MDSSQQKSSPIVITDIGRDRAVQLCMQNHDSICELIAPKKDHAASVHTDQTRYAVATDGHAFGDLLGIATYDRFGLDSLLNTSPEVRFAVQPLLKYASAKMDAGEPREAAEEWARHYEKNSSIPLSATPLKHSKYSLHLSLSIQYVPELAQKEHERNGNLHIYISQDAAVECAEPVIIQPTETAQRVELVFELRSQYMPHDCALNLFAVAEIRNSHDDWVNNQAGFSSILLQELFQQHDSTQYLTVPCSRKNVRKGYVHIKLLDAKMKGIEDSTAHETPLRITSDADGKQLSVYQSFSKRFDLEEGKIVEYINRVFDFYKKHPPRADSIRRVTVFKYQAQTGVLPGSLFDLFRVPLSRESYYLNALEIAVQRRLPRELANKRPNLLASDWLRHADNAFRVRTAMDMLCVYVSYCPYVTDKVDCNTRGGYFNTWNEKLVELMDSFDVMRWKDAGDCEDFSREILQQSMEIKHNKFSSPVMHELQRIFDDFLFFSELCGVSNRALSESSTKDESSISQVQLQGHEAAFAIPKKVFYDALLRAEPAHPLLSAVTEVERQKGAGEIIYVLEGTGKLQPEPSRESVGEEMLQDLLSSVATKLGGATGKAIEDSVSTFHYVPGESCFYKMMITLLTPEFYLSTGSRYFAALACHRQKDGSLPRGVWFEDMVRMHDVPQVCIVPYPEMPEDVVDASVHISRNDYPVPVLKEFEAQPEMLSVAQSLNSEPNYELLREFNIPKGSEHSIYVRFELATPEALFGIKKAVFAIGLGMCAAVEPVKLRQDGHIVGGYRLTFFT